MQGMAPRAPRCRSAALHAALPHRPARARGASSCCRITPRARTAPLPHPLLPRAAPMQAVQRPAAAHDLAPWRIAGHPAALRADCSKQLGPSHGVPVEAPMRPPARGALPRRGRARRTGSAGRPRSGGPGPPSPCLRSAGWRAHRVTSPPTLRLCVARMCENCRYKENIGHPQPDANSPTPCTHDCSSWLSRSLGHPMRDC
jgi:hypothetical protein